MTWELKLGDCLDPLAGLASLPDKSVDVIVTSPPYNQMVSLEKPPSGLWAKTGGAKGFIRAWTENGYADDLPEHEYQEQQNAMFSMLAAKCTDTASLFYNHQLRWRDGRCLHPVSWFAPDGWTLRQEIIWNRGGGIMFNARMFVRFDERILWFVRSDSWKWNQDSVGHGTVWDIAREQQQQGKLHPVQFPLEIPSRCIAAASDPGDLILDPFAGSGTTGVAAIRLGRRFIGYERDPRYHAAAVRRIQGTREQTDLFRPRGPKSVQGKLL